MGVAGDYIYQQMHWYTLAAVFAGFLVLLFFGYRLRKSPEKSRKLLVAVSVFQIAFEIGWRLIYLFIKKCSPVELWPMYPCNLGGILVPLFALLNWQKGKKLFYLFGFIGGILTFAMPDDIFTSSVMVFPIVKSILQHTGLLFIPMLEYVAGTYRPSLKDMGWITVGCLIHAVNCEGITRLLGLTEDYMFFRSGLPFVIPGVPQFITLSVFALAVFAIIAFLCDIKGSIALFKKSDDPVPSNPC